jgi:pimeloyl-ACP methyl ester carboxylesterase
MKTKVFRIISILILVVLILAIATLIAGSVAKANLAKQHPAPGQLVDVGGYKLHINCTGEGSPTVILEAGFADYSATWTYVQPEVAKTTRVCSYDRAGYGWSDPSPHPRTATWRMEELHKLLVNADVQGPYVLVGHSLGGMLVRAYAHSYPDEVAGMVLVDSMHEEQYDRLPGANRTIPDIVRQFRTLGVLNSTGFMALVPQAIPNQGLPDEILPQYKVVWATTGFFATAAAEMSAMEESTAEVRAMRITSFGSLPLRVISAGIYYPNPALNDTENRQFQVGWQTLQTELVALSSDSKQVIAEQSGHDIQFDQPNLVIDVIQEMMDSIARFDPAWKRVLAYPSLNPSRAPG